ncbi:DNA methyltransferase [Myxococcus virescens]|uniref:site-specific DNA-methyltransferase (cytosine-N(4)-specific) n=1 Tax=Myxococcus virescens TaxID=83456 RepID=A0ABY0NDA2_9BACT|nr:Methyltransferase domain-containing protein [Myxococcus virescens]
MRILTQAPAVPSDWATLDFDESCSLHGVAPYIGRLKAAIARSLVLQYSRPGELVADPFCGSGTIPLEALLHGRSVTGADCNEYAVLLTRAKTAKETLDDVRIRLASALTEAAGISIDLRRVPLWVRRFFHPRTLKEALAFASVLKSRDDSFLLACLLGILHHQRPGFLSFPSSHLVPYLRTRSFPPERFPEMYEYRDIESRMLRKIERTFSRVGPTVYSPATSATISLNRQPSRILIPKHVDCIITSPPYMNALDYVRDNRLRLWLLSGRHDYSHSDESVRSSHGFRNLMRTFLDAASRSLRARGYCVLVVGEATRRSDLLSHPARVVLEEAKGFHDLRVVEVLRDAIPDIRRSRRNCEATKSEVFIVLRKRATLRPV